MIIITITITMIIVIKPFAFNHSGGAFSTSVVFPFIVQLIPAKLAKEDTVAVFVPWSADESELTIRALAITFG